MTKKKISISTCSESTAIPAKAGKFLLRLAYPPVCEGCGDPWFKSEIPGVCETCLREKLRPVTAPYCAVCGQTFETALTELLARCGNCGGRHLDFDFALGAYRAEGAALEWMRRYKYAGEIHFARTFGSLLARVWEMDPRLAAEDSWTVVPVPLHWRRKFQRGFNQSLEIAREWLRRSPPGKSLNLVQALKRTRFTTQQASLDREERLSNLRGAFALARSPKISPGANIILLDDVLTTGTTAAECATVIRENLQPNKISVISVLRG